MRHLVYAESGGRGGLLYRVYPVPLALPGFTSGFGKGPCGAPAPGVTPPVCGGCLTGKRVSREAASGNGLAKTRVIRVDEWMGIFRAGLSGERGDVVVGVDMERASRSAVSTATAKRVTARTPAAYPPGNLPGA